MAQATISLAAQATELANLALSEKAALDKAAAAREGAQKLIAGLHKAKASIGRYGQCATATAFMDTLTAGGLSKGTAKNYLTTLRDAVKSGKFEGWNKARIDAKKGKGGKGKGQAAFADLLLKAFNHDEGKTLQGLCESIQSDYEAAKIDNIYQGFVEYLKSEGYEIAE